jgi:PTS system galactitol-specific IIA component
VSIVHFLRPEAISLQLEARSSEEVIRTLGTSLFQLGCVKENFVEATLKREANMPTGLPLSGDVNAAIPHVDIEYVNQSALALATLQRPVIFHNMVEPEEDVPVRLVIMLALDQPKLQIETLQEVAEILQKPAVIDILMAARTTGDIFKTLDRLEKGA